MVTLHYTLFQIKDRTLYDDEKETLSSPIHIILYTAHIVRSSMHQSHKIF